MYGLGPYGTTPYGAPADDGDDPDDIDYDLLVSTSTVEMEGYNVIADIISRSRGRTTYGAVIKPWRLGDR